MSCEFVSCCFEVPPTSLPISLECCEESFYCLPALMSLKLSDPSPKVLLLVIKLHSCCAQLHIVSNLCPTIHFPQFMLHDHLTPLVCCIWAQDLGDSTVAVHPVTEQVSNKLTESLYLTGQVGQVLLHWVCLTCFSFQLLLNPFRLLIYILFCPRSHSQEGTLWEFGYRFLELALFTTAPSGSLLLHIGSSPIPNHWSFSSHKPFLKWISYF